MEFNFNDKFLNLLNELLDKREARLNSKFARISDIPFLSELVNDVSDLKDTIQNTDLEYYDLSEISDEIHYINTNLEKLDLSDSHELLTRIKQLEDDNKELKDRLLMIENFLLKTLKGFKDD